MAGNLEPDPVATNAVRRMMQGAGLESAPDNGSFTIMDGNHAEAMLKACGTLAITALTLLIDAGVSVDLIDARMDLVARLTKADQIDKTQDILRAAKTVLRTGTPPATGGDNR